MPSDKQYHKEYSQRNKEKLVNAVKKWREENPERYKEYNREYQRSISPEKRKEYQDRAICKKLEEKRRNKRRRKTTAKRLK